MENNYLPDFVTQAFKDRIQEIVDTGGEDMDDKIKPVIDELKKINNDIVPQDIIDMIPFKEEVEVEPLGPMGPMNFTQLASYLTDDYSWIKVKHLNFPDIEGLGDDLDTDYLEKAYSELLEHHVKETEFLIKKVRDIAQDYHDFKMKKMRDY